MKLVRKGSDHTKVAAAAPDGPEEVRVLTGAGVAELAVGGDDIGGDEVVTGQTVLACQPAEATTQREARNARTGDQAPRCSQAEGLRLVIEVSPRGPALSAGRAAHRIDADAPHAREVDHQAALAYSDARDIVAAASYRHQQVVGPGEVDRRDDIGGPSTAGDERGVAVDHAVPDCAGVVIARVARTEEWATQAGREALHSRRVQHEACPAGGRDV